MIYASDFRKGITFEINGEPHVVFRLPACKAWKRSCVRKNQVQKHTHRSYQRRGFQPG